MHDDDDFALLIVPLDWRVSDNDDGDDDDEYKRAGYMHMMMTIFPSSSSPFFTGRWVKQK